MRSTRDGLVSAATDTQALTNKSSSGKWATQSVTPCSNGGLIDLKLFDVGEHRITCPACGRSARDKTLGITVREVGDAVAHCFRCNRTQSLKSRSPAYYRPIFKPQGTPQAKRTSLSTEGRCLWEQCRPLSGIAVAYLHSRKCAIPPADGDLRWHPALKHPSGHTGPALVGLVTHVETGEPMSLHRTWITETGKAEVSPSRMLLGGHTSKHGVIRLYPDDQVTTGLGIAEGIETALSLAHEYLPVWAAISGNNMGSMPVLNGIECLVVAVDADDAGRSAAENLSRRWYEAGISVKQARVEHGDLNDHLEVVNG